MTTMTTMRISSTASPPWELRLVCSFPHPQPPLHVIHFPLPELGTHFKTHWSLLLSSGEEKPRYEPRFASLPSFEACALLRFKMEMSIFASRVIRSRMRCDRSSRNRAEGCWVLVSCCSVGLGLQEAVVTVACHLGLQGS